MTATTILSDNGASSGSAGIKTTGGNDGTLQLQTTTSGGTATTALTIDTSQNTTLAGYLNAPNTFGFKNRIINGAMMIDQRNAGASVTPASSAFTYTLDRWCFYVNQASKLTTQRSTTAPDGFINSLKITSSSAYSIGAGDVFVVFQNIEGFNTADLSWGTVSAKPVTLSFWVQSSLTGTFGGSLKNGSSSRSYPFSYTINAANTWEQKTITVAGDVTGTWATDNSTGIGVLFGLGVGSSTSGTAGAWASANYASATGATSVVGTNGATFYITGVQLEKGSTATSFDYRPYGTELALCQRYYYRQTSSTTNGFFAWGKAYSTGSLQCVVNLPVPLRVNATSMETSAMNTFLYETGSTAGNTPTSIVIDSNAASLINQSIIVNKTGAFTGGAMYWLLGNGGTQYIGFNAEL